MVQESTGGEKKIDLYKRHIILSHLGPDRTRGCIMLMLKTPLPQFPEIKFSLALCLKASHVCLWTTTHWGSLQPIPSPDPHHWFVAFKTITCLFDLWFGFSFGATLGGAQGFLFVLHSGITPGGARGIIYVMLRIESGLTMCKRVSYSPAQQLVLLVQRIELYSSCKSEHRRGWDGGSRDKIPFPYI